MQNQQQIQNDEIIEAVEIPRFIKQMVAYVTSGRNQIDNISDGVQKTFDFKVVYLASICGVGAVIFLAYNANKMPMFTSKIVMPKAAVTTTATPKKVVKTQVIEGFDGMEGILDESTGKRFDGQKKNALNEGITEMPIKKAEKPSYDLAPASPEELNAQSVKAYIERYSKVAIAEMDKFGIPASITMAQAIVESRSGKSVLAVKNNNHFGIKCFSKGCANGHCSNYTDDNHKDFFRKYATSTDSWREHSLFLMKNRYRDLLKFGKNYKVWAKGLRDFGYATDKSYDTKLIAVIERYELNKLDDL